MIPVDITFRSMDPSPAVETSINSWVEGLDRYFDQVERCSVVIETPHRHHQQGQTFHVRIELQVPGRTIVVSRDPGLDHTHEDLYVALGDAYQAAKRQLQDHARVHRGDVKVHA